jgi:hypothetical protein
MASSYTLVVALAVQAALLSAYLAWRERHVLVAIVKAWRPSMVAGFMGALASEFWFAAFALTTAANVRTLALVGCSLPRRSPAWFSASRSRAGKSPASPWWSGGCCCCSGPPPDRYREPERVAPPLVQPAFTCDKPA